MGPRLAPILGLLAGVLAAGLVFVAVFAFLPDPPVASPSPSPSPSPSAPASATPDGSTAAPSPSPTTDTGFMIGEEAPPLVLPGLGSDAIDLAALRGSPVWVNFMATWCPPCRDELPLMNALAAEHAADGLVVIAVDVREDVATVTAFMDEVGVTFPVALDADGAAQADWGAFALPVHYWIDASGVIRDGAIGAIGPDVMETGLASILPPASASR